MSKYTRVVARWVLRTLPSRRQGIGRPSKGCPRYVFRPQSSDSVSDRAQEIMQQVASDLNKSKRQSFFKVAIADCDHGDYLAGDSLQQDIFRWLSPPDPWKNHHIACKSRHGGSAAWFIQGNTFSEWKASEALSPLLWVHGKRQLMPSSYAFFSD